MGFYSDERQTVLREVVWFFCGSYYVCLKRNLQTFFLHIKVWICVYILNRCCLFADIFFTLFSLVDDPFLLFADVDIVFLHTFFWAAAVEELSKQFFSGFSGEGVFVGVGLACLFLGRATPAPKIRDVAGNEGFPK